MTPPVVLAAGALAAGPLIANPSAAPDPAETLLALDDNLIAGLVFGLHDQNLARLERRLGVQATANGNRVMIRGPVEAREQAKAVLESLYLRARAGAPIGAGDVDGAIAEGRALLPREGGGRQGSLFPDSGFEQISTRKRGPVRARNAAQSAYLKALKAHELVLALGPAGTGKTWLAVGHAVGLLETGRVERIILSRPAVEAGERLGFLPGDLKEKVDPYLRPIYDALYDFMEARAVDRGLATGVIEIAPLAFMRGRTLTNAAILLDEAQNTTAMQMKMALTRIGENARMIVTGDPSQIDLPRGVPSGLVEASRILEGVEGVAQSTFAGGDVVRHDLVRRIVEAYDAEGGEAATSPS